MAFPQFLLVLSSYIVGGIPTGYWIARFSKGIDIREHGTGNPGAANVYRMVGKIPGLATLAGDILKGYVPVALALRLWPADLEVQAACGAAAIAGHVWMIFLKFDGGKGVATTAGVFLALLPQPLLAALGLFCVSAAFSGHISVGSMTAALVFPLFALFAGPPTIIAALAVGASAFILYKHIPNLRTLRAGKNTRGKLQ